VYSVRTYRGSTAAQNDDRFSCATFPIVENHSDGSHQLNHCSVIRAQLSFVSIFPVGKRGLRCSFAPGSHAVGKEEGAYWRGISKSMAGSKLSHHGDFPNLSISPFSRRSAGFESYPTPVLLSPPASEVAERYDYGQHVNVAVRWSIVSKVETRSGRLIRDINPASRPPCERFLGVWSTAAISVSASPPRRQSLQAP
jgi:hypothetical protein